MWIAKLLPVTLLATCEVKKRPVTVMPDLSQAKHLIKERLIMKTKTLIKALGAAGMALGMSQAFSANIPFPTSGTFLLSDNSAESLINCTPGAAGCESTSVNDTTLDVGDRLRGVFGIDTISGQSILTGSGFDELAGIFDVTVTSAVQNFPGNWTFEFGATAGFAAEFGLSAGAAVAWFTDSTHEFIREDLIANGTTIAQMEALINDGTLFWGSGFTDSAFWRAQNVSTNDVSTVGALPGNTAAGQFQFGLNLTDNFSGRTFSQVGCFNAGIPGVVQVDQCANGNILSPATGQGNNTPFDVWDDVNFTMNVNVPEPSLVALLGLGMLGVGASSLAKRRKSRV